MASRAILLSVSVLAGMGQSGCVRPGLPPVRAETGEAAAEDSIRRIASGIGGELSLSAIHVESGRRLQVGGDVPVFMSSVVKLPLAVQLLERVDRREILLDEKIVLRASDMRLGHSPLAELWPDGVTLSVRELIRYALSDSDNSASDALLARSGGPAGVMATLRNLGVRGTRVDRGYYDYILDFTGTRSPPGTGWTRDRLDSLTSASPPAARDSGSRAFAADFRDRATAHGLAELLARIASGAVLSDSARSLLIHFMTDTRNPAGRIVAGLPQGTTVAHKTGTWGRPGLTIAVNDAALIQMPDGTRLALVVLVRNPQSSVPDVEAAMAAITRVACAWAANRLP